MSMCVSCRSKHDEWFDYLSSAPVKYQAHASDNPQRDRRMDLELKKSIMEQRRSTVRFQQNLIKKHCKENHS